MTGPGVDKGAGIEARGARLNLWSLKAWMDARSEDPGCMGLRSLDDKASQGVHQARLGRIEALELDPGLQPA